MEVFETEEEATSALIQYESGRRNAHKKLKFSSSILSLAKHTLAVCN